MIHTDRFAMAVTGAGLVAYQIGEQFIFPVYGVNGNLKTVACAYVAKSYEDFPHNAEFEAVTGISRDGKYYRIDMDGRVEQNLSELMIYLHKIKEVLS